MFSSASTTTVYRQTDQTVTARCVLQTDKPVFHPLSPLCADTRIHLLQYKQPPGYE